MECSGHLRNIQDLLSDGKSPHERCFGEPFGGPAIPFGWMIEYHPISAKEQSRLHQFGKKALPGIFLGYVLHAEWHLERRHNRHGHLRSCTILEASEIHARRLSAKELLKPINGDFFIFADGTGKLSGRDQGF